MVQTCIIGLPGADIPILLIRGNNLEL
uniref:Uncharacterized protein n=1 Tax=Arundo donax TaxID=35708 RepID=A0A0A9CBQ2_ARUDO